MAAGYTLGATTRLFCFWMAFEGLSQALTQLAVGLFVPGNDVDRALAYLKIGRAGHVVLAVAAVAALTASGKTLPRLFPTDAPNRIPALGGSSIVLLSAMLSILLIIPFRVPRSAIETALIPLIVNGIGAGWTILGFGLASNALGNSAPVHPKLAIPALSLLALLLIFQLVLRPGIRF